MGQELEEQAAPPVILRWQDLGELSKNELINKALEDNTPPRERERERERERACSLTRTQRDPASDRPKLPRPATDRRRTTTIFFVLPSPTASYPWIVHALNGEGNPTTRSPNIHQQPLQFPATD